MKKQTQKDDFSHFIETTVEEYERIQTDWSNGLNKTKKPCVILKNVSKVVPKSFGRRQESILCGYLPL